MKQSKHQPQAFEDLEARLGRDAESSGGPVPDVLGQCSFAPRPRWAARRRLMARAAVCGSLAVFLMVGARERAGLERAVRLVPAANSRTDVPRGPATAVKDVAAFLAGSGEAPLRQEWRALADDAQGLLDQLSRRMAPMASLLAEPD